jgi:hypothetical protein
MTFREQMREAFLSLARTQRRESWTYRKWAWEERDRGDPEKYHRYAAEAIRRWREAKSAIQSARNW